MKRYVVMFTYNDYSKHRVFQQLLAMPDNVINHRTVSLPKVMVVLVEANSRSEAKRIIEDNILQDEDGNQIGVEEVIQIRPVTPTLA